MKAAPDDNVQQQIYSSKDLPPELKWQVLSFLRIYFPDGFMGENRLRNWISQDEHTIHIVLVEQDILISHTEVKWKQLDHAGMSYKVYGLSGVLTYPAFRGQGYGRRIVEAGTAYIRSTDADIGMFHCTPGLKGFYAKAGWIPMEHTITLVGTKHNPVRSDELMMMQFFSAKGRQGQPSFEGTSLYFGEDTW
jgi:GNAT superfamily N-acetyltransferase